ncbi:recombinase family protein [Variovorax sp. PAMC 28711]|uniref:recombinase family protein n=1 Tax=Variovorax sp. PAMC 28711 TaxID=1795631 RepID=UPI00078CC5A3|nr:recombinase family protein [Variovorax sp. PAMC 28711]AMM23838.1 transposase [Variovorax sp. PAMC 28711]
MRVGYVRVSTAGQHDARQLDGVPLDKTFADQASGKDTERPQLKAMLEFVREGDCLFVHSMDRLSRSLRDLQDVVKGLTDRGVSVWFVKEGMKFTSSDDPMATLMLQLLGAVSQFERALIKERQREGIAIAKASGVYKGRKPALNKEAAETLRDMAVNGIPKAQIASTLGISRATVYEYLKTTA